MNVSGNIKRLHKWVSVLVGLQLLIWLLTGLYFNLIDHKKARGDANRVSVTHFATHYPSNISPLSAIPVKQAQSIKLHWIMGEPYYLVIHDEGFHSYQPKNTELFSADTLMPYNLNARDAELIALASYTEQAKVINVALVEPPVNALPRQQNPVWRVALDDEVETEVYIDNSTGRVIAHVNDNRRLHNLMFKLHFMDYLNEGSFNNPFMIVFASAALLLSASGLFWLISLYRIGLLLLPFSHRKKKLSLVSSDGNHVRHLNVDSQSTLLDALNEQGLALRSICGGGGTCGKCRFHSPDLPAVTDAERQLLTPTDIENGVRLGCQHTVAEVNKIILSK